MNDRLQVLDALDM